MKQIRSFIETLSQNPIITFLSGFLLLFLGRSLSFSYEWVSIIFYILSGLVFIGSVLLFSLAPDMSKKEEERGHKKYPDNLKKALWVFWYVGFTALLLYLLQIEPLWNLIADSFENQTIPEVWQGVKKFFQFAYLSLILITFIIGILFQTSLKAVKAESGKALYVQNAAIGVGLLFVFLIALNYSAALRPFSIDLTTLGQYTLSQEGENVVKKVHREVSITAFYPFFHDLYREVELMLTSISSKNPLIKFSMVDAIKEKEIADSKKVDRNGYVIVESIDTNELEISKRNKRKLLSINNENDLKTLEKQLISALINVAYSQKTLYFTVGHGEIPKEGPFTENLVSLLQKELKAHNYSVKELSVKEGFPPDMPDDADAVLILGAKKNFTIAEQKALKNYLLLKDGRVLLTLDPNLPANFSFLLNPFRVRYKRQKLISELSIKGSSESIIMGNYAKHPVTDLFREKPLRQRFSIFPGTGHFETDKTIKKGFLPDKTYKLDYVIKTEGPAWVDKIRNGVHDKQEPSHIRNTALAVSKAQNSQEKKTKDDEIKSKDKTKDSSGFRLIAFADSDFFRNKYLSWPGKNYEIIVNSIQWLLEDETITGILPKERGKKQIKLSDGEDDFVFYFLVFFWPLLILSGGLYYLRILRQKAS